MRESNVLRATWLAVAAVGTTLFRLNTGRAWLSNLGPKKGVRRLADGSVLILSPRSVAIGFGMTNGDPVVGASDLNGWTEIVITPAMIGRKVAIYTAIETKESGGGDKSEEQVNFVEQVRQAGGIAGFASSPEDALKVIREYSEVSNYSKMS